MTRRIAFDVRKAEIALRRASQKAREIALRTGTPLVVYRDGKTLLLDPKDLSIYQEKQQ